MKWVHKLSNLKRVSLKVKLTFYVTIVIIAIMSLVIIFFAQQQTRSIISQTSKRGIAITRSLSSITANKLVTYSYLELEQIVNRIKLDSDVVYVIILDKEGKIAAYSKHPEKQGQFLNDEITKRAFLSKTTLTQRTVYKDNSDGYEQKVLDVSEPVFIQNSNEKWGTVRVGLSLEPMQEELKRTLFILGIIGIIAIIIGILGTVFLSQQIVKPLNLLVERAIKAANGDLENKITIKTGDEIEELANNFNYMMEQILFDRIQIQELNKDLENRIIQRTQSLVKANAELARVYQEIQRAQSQLVQSEKMASLGLLVAGVAHELNNPTNFIYANVQHLSNYFQQLRSLMEIYELYISEAKKNELNQLKLKMDIDYILKDTDEILKSFRHGAERIKDIVIDLRLFSRLGESEIKVIDIHESIDNTIKLLTKYLEKGVMIYKDYDKLPHIECYASQINQVFMNLLVNAIQAVNKEGKIWIKTRQNGQKVFISIKDNGVGISPENLSKIFDPFFTTKEVGVGTGLGLSITYGIIQKHNGNIKVESEIGKGSNFIIELPMKLKNVSAEEKS